MKPRKYTDLIMLRLRDQENVINFFPGSDDRELGYRIWFNEVDYVILVHGPSRLPFSEHVSCNLRWGIYQPGNYTCIRRDARKHTCLHTGEGEEYSEGTSELRIYRGNDV